ncbi:MAG TPA: sigma-54-dependent Fis family transcriptional regulator, partial [Nevskiaceae bacterium]|nr:sigma-54-dependent Fis family transcriptional regulator [Nevskiaceae bacterium]
MRVRPSMSHDEMVAALTRGRWDPLRVDGSIARSWDRSAGHSLDPETTNAPQVLPAHRLREYRAPLEPLLHVARGAMETLHQQVRDAGYVILLTNPEGITVDFMNNLPLDRELRRAGLYLGGCWPEGVEGTNAIGLCVVERRPVTVHQSEHFRKVNATLTCSSVPLRSETGELLAVLDASALYSPDEKRSQLLILQMVVAAAAQIENAYFLQRFERNWILRISRRRELLEVAADGLIALDDGGRILAANAPICQALGEEQASMVGRAIDDVLHMPFARIADAESKSSVLHWPHLAGGLYGVARRPIRLVLPASLRSQRRTDAPSLAALAGGDPQMQACVERARLVLDKGIAILLQGETGTGKELFARAVHQASSRAAAPFVALNCAAIPETLIESELFGYRSGAFTGALAKGAQGKLVLAHGGTLFLDEIGDMPPALQTRLLRVLSEREVTPLGTDKAVPVDLQVICATHRDLVQLVQSGAFREDLYYRINGISLQLPPLRERADRPELIEALLAEESAALGRASCSLSDEAGALLVGYSWPGNVRQ